MYLKRFSPAFALGLIILLLIFAPFIVPPASGKSSADGPVSPKAGRDDPQPDHPVRLVEATTTTITIEWDAVDGAKGYGVSWWPINYDDFQSRYVRETSYKITGLRPGADYVVKVDGIGAEPLEVTTTAPTPTATPVPPTPTPPPDPVISISAGSGVTEGGSAAFTLAANPAPSAALAVSINVSQQGDYGVTTGSQTVTVGTSGAATLTVSTIDDGVDETDGSVTATLVGGTGYAVGASSSATVAVADDDVPALSIAAGGDITEGGNASFTVTASPAPYQALLVPVTVADSGDFASSGQAGSRTITVPVAGTVSYNVGTDDDSADEADGTITATLATGSGYTVGSSGSAAVAVSDNDDAPPPTFVPDAALVATVTAKADNHPSASAAERLRKIVKGMTGEAGGYTAAECRETATHHGVLNSWQPWCDEIEKAEAAASVPRPTPTPTPTPSATPTPTTTMDELIQTRTDQLVELIQARIDQAAANRDRRSERTWRSALAAVRSETPTKGVKPMTVAKAQRLSNQHRNNGRGELADLWQDIANLLTAKDNIQRTDRPLTQNEETVDPADDDYPSDMTTTGALAIRSHTVSLTGAVDYPGDTDWIRLSFEKSGYYNLSVNAATCESSLCEASIIRLYDEQGNALSEDYDVVTRWPTTVGGGVNYLERSFPAGGVFYAAVGSSDGSQTGDYLLTLGQMQLDHYADDTTAKHSIFVNSGWLADINHPTDTDWFKASLKAGKTYLIQQRDAYDTRPGMLHYPRIHGADGTVLAEPHFGEGFALITYQPPQTGRYYIAGGIAPGSQVIGGYLLTLSTHPSDDYAADIATTGSVAVGDTTAGAIETFGDTDWLAVSLEAGATYTVTLNHGAVDIDHYLIPYERYLLGIFGLTGVYDGSGALLAQPAPSSSTTTADWKPLLVYDGIPGGYCPEEYDSEDYDQDDDPVDCDPPAPKFVFDDLYEGWIEVFDRQPWETAYTYTAVNSGTHYIAIAAPDDREPLGTYEVSIAKQ